MISDNFKKLKTYIEKNFKDGYGNLNDWDEIISCVWESRGVMVLQFELCVSSNEHLINQLTNFYDPHNHYHF